MSSLTIEAIEEIAKLEKEQLKDDALRTIRQRDPEKGMGFLNQIEGIERFVQSLHRACNSSFYRQLDYAQRQRENQPPPKVAQMRRKPGRLAAGRGKVS